MVKSLWFLHPTGHTIELYVYMYNYNNTMKSFRDEIQWFTEKHIFFKKRKKIDGLCLCLATGEKLKNKGIPSFNKPLLEHGCLVWVRGQQVNEVKVADGSSLLPVLLLSKCEPTVTSFQVYVVWSADNTDSIFGLHLGLTCRAQVAPL